VPATHTLTLRFVTAALLTAATLAPAGCGDRPDSPGAGAPGDTTPAAGGSVPPSSPAADTTGGDRGPSERAGDRPAERTDTLRLEGMPEPIALRLFRSPDGFPLPFTAYVPTDMEAEAESDGTVRVTARFGGTPSPDAFVHLMVHPEGTDRQVALGTARAYKTGRGVPVSQGLEPIAERPRPPGLEWALEAYRFRYQSGGRWFVGTLGVGQRAGRFFQLVRHYPAEYAEGFAPRADLLVESWRWADGAGLRE
jgi:hypothetical protein